MTDYRDLTIEALADAEATLQDTNRQLVDLLAKLTIENATLTTLWKHELVQRIHADATIARLRRKLSGDRNHERQDA